MATFDDVTITWAYIQGSAFTKVKYKQDGATSWITPTYTTNPTQNLYYVIPALDTSLTYDIQLTHMGDCCNCATKTISFTIKFPGNCKTCPSGYTLSPDQSYCYQESDTPATPPSGGNPQNSVANTNAAYTSCGSYIYNSGWNSNGTGTSTLIPLSNPFWINGTGDCGLHTVTDGPLNRCGLWSTTISANQVIGFSVCLDFSTSTTYYIGIASDNWGSISLDGTIILQQDPAAISLQYTGSNANVDRTFKIWHIYPVVIPSGPHILEMKGNNDNDATAAFGAEIYNNTAAQIQAATSYSALNLIFSTKNYIGQPIQSGSGGTGYSCPAGYALSSCSNPPLCKKYLTAAPINC